MPESIERKLIHAQRVPHPMEAITGQRGLFVWVAKDGLIECYLAEGGKLLGGVTLDDKALLAIRNAKARPYDKVKALNPVAPLPDRELTLAEKADRLKSQHESIWSEAEGYPIGEWKHEIEDGTTRLGYWEWVAAKQELEG